MSTHHCFRLEESSAVNGCQKHDDRKLTGCRLIRWGQGGCSPPDAVTPQGLACILLNAGTRIGFCRHLGLKVSKVQHSVVALSVTTKVVPQTICNAAGPCMKSGTAQHSTAQHSTAQHSTAQHSTAQHSTAQHSRMMCMLN